MNIAKITKYDPAIPSYNTIPKAKFDCLLNTDVMEHIPPDKVDDVLAGQPDLGRLGRRLDQICHEIAPSSRATPLCAITNSHFMKPTAMV